MNGVVPRPDDPGNPTVDFHGERRSNQTHESTTDPRLAPKSGGHEAKLAYCGNVLIENRNGLVVDTELLGFDTLQTGTDTNGRPTFLTAPRTSDRTTDTSISVRDNEIVALGGLMRDSKTLNVNKIPLLGDIPLLGHLFRNTTTETVKTELMIFLIPHVVDSDAQNRAMIQNEAKGIMKIMPELKNPQTKHWNQAFRLLDLLM